MTPEIVLAAAALAFFLIIALFAARAGYVAIALDERQQLPMRLFWSITRTVWVVGPLLFIAVLWLLLFDAPKGDTGGIMSRNTGIAVLAVGAAIALALTWASAVTLGFVAGAIARTLPLRVAVAVIFGALLLTPLLCTGTVVAQHQLRTTKPRR